MKLRALCALLLCVACARPAPSAPLRATAVASTPVGPEPAREARPDARPASPSELAVVRRLMRETEALRGLRFLGPVDVTIEGPTAMRAYVQRALDRESLERATRRYVALGAIDPSLDVQALLLSVMQEELIGYYDPVEKRLAVRGDIARALDVREDDPRSLAWRATVVHELVHALQDQHFDLGAAVQRERSTDADNAFGALVEGDATFAMLGYTAGASASLQELARQPDRVLAVLSRPLEQLSPALRAAPPLLRDPLLFRYREGARFCARLFAEHGWARIDRAHRSLPRSTRAIRYPEQALQVERAYAVELPSLELTGLIAVDEDTLGALELSVLLALPPAQAARVFEEWRGDRYRVLQRGDELASLWLIELRTRTGARALARAFLALGDPLRRVVQRERRVVVARGLHAAELDRALDRLAMSRDATASSRADPLASSAGGH